MILAERLRQALSRLNPQVPADAIGEAYRKLTRPELPSLVANNHLAHKFLVEGVPVEYQRTDGSIGGDSVRVLDLDDIENNEFLAVNQFTVVEDRHERRPDIVLFVNGLPLAVIELKNAADEGADIWRAFNQLQTYKQQIPSLFTFNEALVVSDGVQARIGTLTADREWFMPWRTIEGEELADTRLAQLQVVLEGVFDKRRLLDLVRYFTVFEDVGGGVLVKKMAGYHQFHAVNKALESTVESCSAAGDRRVGVVWHTQGSGKSLTMAFYAGRVVLHPTMENPTIVVITDRNDLDDQLFGTFGRCHELLRQLPEQAANRAHLRELLRVAAGGIVFTTIHKFFPIESENQHPLLSDRRNIVVIADEAHRSQYDFIDGFARHMREALPKASFIGFTGTPIELADANTRSVFGDYISIYDIERAVKDGATVPIYYESRLAKIALDESQRPKLDPDFEEATEGEEIEHKEKLKTKWAAQYPFPNGWDDDEILRRIRDAEKRDDVQRGSVVHRKTDLGNAERFRDQHGDDVRFCHPWGKWLIWDGRRWAIDDSGEVMRRTKQTARSIYVEASRCDSDEESKKLAGWAIATEQGKYLNAMVTLAKSELPIAVEELDAQSWLVNCQNGTIDLRTGELREHQRGDY